MSEKVATSNLLHIQLENGHHLEIKCETIEKVVVRDPPPQSEGVEPCTPNPSEIPCDTIDKVVVRDPPPDSERRLLVFTNHDLGFGYIAVTQVHLVEGRAPTHKPTTNS